MPTIKGNLVLEKDTVYDEPLTVEGSICGKDGVRYDLTVRGNIQCRDITCRDIDCRNITCGNITCGNITCIDIDCGNIDCRNINCLYIDCLDISAGFILCESLKQQDGSKLVAKNVIENRSGYTKKEIKR